MAYRNTLGTKEFVIITGASDVVVSLITLIEASNATP
jgi:hypothetical protein